MILDLFLSSIITTDTDLGVPVENRLLGSPKLHLKCMRTRFWSYWVDEPTGPVEIDPSTWFHDYTSLWLMVMITVMVIMVRH